jgi:hypothetical protein
MWNPDSNSLIFARGYDDKYGALSPEEMKLVNPKLFFHDMQEILANPNFSLIFI